tara:strand:+ start:1018 stop:1158 length:141 start_codon:yes stop_codon:yes gene_type:complete
MRIKVPWHGRYKADAKDLHVYVMSVEGVVKIKSSNRDMEAPANFQG